MSKLIGKIAQILLFILGMLWGNLWITRILSCPEWWFISSMALLCGTGIYLVHFLPANLQKNAPAICLMPLLLLPDGLAADILLPLFFGAWYGGNRDIFNQWQRSRTFCGGMIIGGVTAGIFSYSPLKFQWLMEKIFSPQTAEYIQRFEFSFSALMVPVLTVTLLLYAILKSSRGKRFEVALLMFCYIALYSPAPAAKSPPPPEPGTVISAFSLLEKMEKVPKAAFIGINHNDAAIALRELDPVADIVLLPELPGTLPTGCDMIFISGLPEHGDGGKSALLRALNPGGILIHPVNDPLFLPDTVWYILPGSDGRYAVTSPDRELKTDPEKMDENLAYFYRKRPNIAPTRGVLAGLLTGFESRRIKIAVPEKIRSKYWYIIPSAAAILLLLVITVKYSRRKQLECSRIMINCSGYAMLGAMLFPVILADFPPVSGLRSLLAAAALIWIFRRPYKRRRDFFCVAGFLSLTALALSWNGSSPYAAAALIFGGYTFAALDGELLQSRRNNGTEAIRFLGFAAGLAAVGAAAEFQLPYSILFLIVTAMRFWSWFRN